MATWKTVLLALALLLLPASALAQTTTPFTLSVVAEGFDSPVFLTAPAGDPRLFVVEQPGRIRIIEDGKLLETPFLDVSERIAAGGEQGLLGLAFHPDYASNGRFFVTWTARGQGQNETVAFQVSEDPDVADPDSGKVLISIKDFAGNHNGGWLAFGPDGLLYIGTGDGGGGGDPMRNGQNPDALLGKILRIDVDHGDPYAIPPENPFANGGGAPEVFVLGTRNPWRNSFDGDNLFIADVGQGTWEEVDVITIADAGVNLGWSTMEGSECYNPATGCDTAGLTKPVFVYNHDVGCSITGGYVYRGQAIPALVGRYVFADYCGSKILSLVYENGEARDFVNHGADHQPINEVLSFGTDSAGELYVLTGNGRVVKFVPKE